eukprot:scaffold15874_cov150-Isochrysis_galbana.AAC.7
MCGGAWALCRARSCSERGTSLATRVHSSQRAALAVARMFSSRPTSRPTGSCKRLCAITSGHHCAVSMHVFYWFHLHLQPTTRAQVGVHLIGLVLGDPYAVAMIPAQDWYRKIRRCKCTLRGGGCRPDCDNSPIITHIAPNHERTIFDSSTRALINAVRGL